MANDTREDHGSYYPGAKVIVSGNGTSGTSTDISGKVDRVTIGEIGDTYTLKTVKEKVYKLIKTVAPVASCLAAMLCMSTAMAATEVFEDIPSNARVVISEDDPVALAAIPEAVGAATNAAVETAKTYADAAVAVEASNRVDDVKSVLVRSKSYTDTATNALAAKIPVVDLEPYATKTWIEAKGYVTSDALGGVATKDWIGDQGYLTQLAMAPYATMDWVMGKGYATASDINGLATKSELDALKRRYADTNGVTRIWSEDGLTMTDGTGVVWNVTWNVVTNWTSLSNGVVFAQVKGLIGLDYWVSQGIYTNALGQSSSATINFEAGVLSISLDAHAGSTGTFEVSPGQVLVDAHDYGYNDTFSNSTVRVPAFSFRSKVVTNAVGHIAKGTITDGTNTITAAGAITAVGIGRGYWMVRLIPDGAWYKLVPVLGSGDALWRDAASNSYVGDHPETPDGMWIVSVDDSSHRLNIPAERYEAFSDSNAEGYYVPDSKTLATVDQIPTTPGEVGAAPASLAETVSAWQTYWDGDDVRVTVTNYYWNLDIPSLYLEQKMPADETHESSWFKVVWDERTRWNRFMPTFAALTNDVAQNKADRAWGVYDSSTGAYSPDGLLQLSQEQIMIASSMAWQKTVTAGSAIWVLKATSPTMLSGQTENGYFRIQDGDGNALFEIVKGDKRVVGATATGVSMDGTSMRITYAVESAEHPTLEVCTDLRLGDWTTETDTTAATVSWSGSSGDWVATVTPVGARPSLFAKASYEAGGNTYIRNNVATSIDKVVVGGIEYTVTVETVNGKKLLVLR